jgi:multidrug efflux pump subunit AcrA (membrane-fusion protein)
MKRKNLTLVGIFAVLIALAVFLPKGNKPGFGPRGKGKGGATETVFRITTVQSEEKDLHSYLEINGDVEADNTVAVFPDISGKLARLSAHLGSTVRKGEQIAAVDPSKPGASYALSPIYAPISGTVTSMPEKIGATVSTGTTVAVIGDISNLQVTAKIPEREIAVLKTGLQAIVTFEAYPGVDFPATIFRVSPLVDSISRTKEIYLSFNEKDSRVNAGMFAKIKLYTTVAKDAVTVPEDAIVQNYDKYYVYALNDDSTVTKREVRPGVTVDGIVQILSGLKAGERVAYQGVTVLSDGVKVKDIKADKNDKTVKADKTEKGAAQ